MNLSRKYILIIALSFLVASLSPVAVSAAGVKPLTLNVTVGKSIFLAVDKPITRISEPNEAIATAAIVSSTEMIITGKTAGSTNMIVWQQKENPVVYDLVVTYDTVTLKETLASVLPGETEIKILETKDSITLTGQVSSAANLSRALALANAYAPGGKVQNLLEVGGVHQVMLEVRVAEMSKKVQKELGVNFNYVRAGEFGVNTLGGLTTANTITASGFGGLDVSPAVNAFFRFNRKSATWTGFIDALKADGLVKVLAEPNLIALSGQEAKFLAGGEYPIPVPSGNGDISIDYKDYGIKLAFTPTVLSSNKIGIDVAPEVSELDFSAAFLYGGYVVPAVTTRKAATRIELSDGQSFAIAGLLSDTVRENVSKYPFLGEIPVLGALFRSESFIKNETELVIVVTPHLVKPIDGSQLKLPTDNFIEPSSVEFYLEGLMEGREKKDASAQAKYQGDFGHAVPEVAKQ